MVSSLVGNLEVGSKLEIEEWITTIMVNMVNILIIFMSDGQQKKE